MMLDSVIKANKRHYPETLLEECKYLQEKIKTENYIDEDLEKLDQIVTLMMKQNLILIMIKMTKNWLKVF